MIKFGNNTFNDWYQKLNKKPFILSNDGIGDAILSVNFAIHENTSVSKFSDNSYRDNFFQKYCRALNINHFLISRKDKDFALRSRNYEKILQFEYPYRFNESERNTIMSKIYMNNHGFIKENNCDPNVVFICPMGSTNMNLKTRRFMDKNFLNEFINILLSKNNKIYLVGIDKDIEIYGFPNGCKWINTDYIIHNHLEREPINIKKYLQMVANAKLAIASPTSFPILSSMLSVPTLTLHRYNHNNIPITSSNMRDNFCSHFYNINWFKTLRMMRYQEIRNYIKRI